MYQAIPIASLIASVTVMVLLTRTGETTAMRAVGMSPFRIAAPLAAGGMILSLLSFGLGEFVIPYTARRSHYIKQVIIEGEEAGLSEGAYWIRTPRLTLNFKAYHLNSQTLEKVKLLFLSPHTFAPQKVVHAKTGMFWETHNAWLLQNVSVVNLDDDKIIIKTMNYQFLMVNLPLEPQKLKFDRRAPYELSLNEVVDIIETGHQANGDILSYRIAWHMKFAYPLAAFLISFLGLRFGYRIERTSETIKGMFLALVIAMSYWFTLSVTKAYCTTGNLHPIFAGWLANLWISLIIIWQFWRLRREQR